MEQRPRATVIKRRFSGATEEVERLEQVKVLQYAAEKAIKHCRSWLLVAGDQRRHKAATTASRRPSQSKFLQSVEMSVQMKMFYDALYKNGAIGFCWPLGAESSENQLE